METGSHSVSLVKLATANRAGPSLATWRIIRDVEGERELMRRRPGPACRELLIYPIFNVLLFVVMERSPFACYSHLIPWHAGLLSLRLGGSPPRR